MADYKKMYALLCAAADSAIDSLKDIPEAVAVRRSLQAALLRAEEVYIDTEPYSEDSVSELNE